MLAMASEGSVGTCGMYEWGADFPITAFNSTPNPGRAVPAAPPPRPRTPPPVQTLIVPGGGMYTLTQAFRLYRGGYRWSEVVGAADAAGCAEACLAAPRCKFFTQLGPGSSWPGIGERRCMLVGAGASVAPGDNTAFNASSGEVVSRPGGVAPSPKAADDPAGGLYNTVPRHRRYSGVSWWAATVAASGLRCGAACAAAPECGLFTWLGGGFSYRLDGNPNCLLVDAHARVTPVASTAFAAVSGKGEELRPQGYRSLMPLWVPLAEVDCSPGAHAHLAILHAPFPPAVTRHSVNDTEQACVASQDIELFGGDLFSAPHPNAHDAAACCAACSATPRCAGAWSRHGWE